MTSKLTVFSFILAVVATGPAVIFADERERLRGTTPGQIEVQGIVGYAGFVDDAFVDLPHWAAGAAARMYLTPRISFQPEFTYMRRSRADQDFVFVPNLAFDFRKPEQRVRPYLMGGASILYHRGQFFSGTSLTWGLGVGVKAYLSDRWFVSPEFRLGWEPFVRATVGIGYVLRRGNN